MEVKPQVSSANLIEIAASRVDAVLVEDGQSKAIADAVRDCDGFRVVSAEGYVGTIEIVLYGASQQPAALAVRTGLFARQLLLVPIEDVIGAYPVRSTIVLDAGWRPRAAGIADDLTESPESPDALAQT